MKKKNILLFLFTIIFMLGFSMKAHAEGIIGNLECTYKIDQDTANYINKEHVYSKMVSVDNVYRPIKTITFAYTDIKVGEGIQLYSRIYGYDYETDAGVVERWRGLSAKSTGIMMLGTTKGADTEFPATFRTAMEVNGGKCPKYFVIASASDSEPNVPKFTNNMSSECGSNLEKCPIYANLYNETKKIVYPNDIEWYLELPSLDNNKWSKFSCSDANVRFFIDENNALKSEISYPTTSDFYSDTAKKTVITDITVNEDNINGMAYKYVKDLITKNKIGLYSFNGKSGKEGLYFNDEKTKSGSCNVTSGSSFKLNKTCLTLFTFLPQIQLYNDSVIFKQGEFLETTGSLIEIEDLEDNKFKPIDFSGYNDKQQLLSLAAKATDMSVEEMRAFLVEYDAYLTYMKEASENPETCDEAKENLAERTALLDKDISQFEGRFQAYVQSLKNLKEKAEKMGATEEELADVNNVLENADEISALTKQTVSVSKQILFISGIADDLTFTEGCGLLTPGLKKWVEQLLDIVKISALVLTLILGMVDFFRGVASGNADTMKKVWTSFSRRLIVVALLFLLPVIIEFILGMININGLDATNPLCGLK